jgi:predicted Zn-dependent protease
MSADEQWMLYLAMHSAIRLGDFEWAWKAIQHLVQLPQESAAVEALLSADWLSIARQLPQPSVREHEAQARIQRGLKSGWRGEWLAAVRWSIERGQADQVVGALQSKVVTDPLDYEMWTMLALAREAQGETLRMLRAQAEAQWARGNASGAVDRIVAARVWSVAHPAIDPIEAQVVLTRERDMRRFMAAQAAAEAADR